MVGRFTAPTSTIVSSWDKVSEDARLQHRFLDLRRQHMQRNLKLRSKITHACRQALIDLDFTEVETPTLFKSTPEGAREFLVPTRSPGKFYALTQSPQQFKQMLTMMVGGVERYFQIARCYRDEGMRADRQPEFTQVDLEMAFPSQRQIQEVIESVIRRVWAACGQDLPHGAFRRLQYSEVMSRYGSDKPDTRYGMHIQNLTSHFANTGLRALAAKEGASDHGVYGIVARGLGPMAKGKPLAKLQMVSQAYDLVINGFEVGGGSVRIHDPDLQRMIESRFGHLLEALSSGCPPHGGIALGLDRLVMLLCGASNLRDVLAFPKTASGSCLLTQAPSTPTPQQLAEYHIGLVE